MAKVRGEIRETVRVRWSRWLSQVAAEYGVSASGLAERIEPSERSGGYAGLVRAWCAGVKPVMPRYAYRAGEALRSLGVQWSSGVVGLFAAGYVPETIALLANVLMCDEPDAKERVALFVRALPTLDVLDWAIANYEWPTKDKSKETLAQAVCWPPKSVLEDARWNVRLRCAFAASEYRLTDLPTPLWHLDPAVPVRVKVSRSGARVDAARLMEDAWARWQRTRPSTRGWPAEFASAYAIVAAKDYRFDTSVRLASGLLDEWTREQLDATGEDADARYYAELIGRAAHSRITTEKKEQ